MRDTQSPDGSLLFVNESEQRQKDKCADHIGNAQINVQRREIEGRYEYGDDVGVFFVVLGGDDAFDALMHQSSRQIFLRDDANTVFRPFENGVVAEVEKDAFWRIKRKRRHQLQNQKLYREHRGCGSDGQQSVGRYVFLYAFCPQAQIVRCESAYLRSHRREQQRQIHNKSAEKRGIDRRFVIDIDCAGKHPYRQHSNQYNEHKRRSAYFLFWERLTFCVKSKE